MAQLPSRLQTLLKLKQEKEELAKLKSDDPLKTLDPDEASRRRLQEMKDAAQQRQTATPAKLAAIRDDDDEDRLPASRPGAAKPAAATEEVEGAAGSAQQLEGQGDEEDEGPVEGVDPFAGMNARQRKLYELRQRLQQSRKANQTAVVAEKKRQKVSRPPVDAIAGSSHAILCNNLSIAFNKCLASPGLMCLCQHRDSMTAPKTTTRSTPSASGMKTSRSAGQRSWPGWGWTHRKRTGLCSCFGRCLRVLSAAEDKSVIVLAFILLP